MIAVFLPDRRPSLLDRARALLRALPTETVVIGSGPAPAGWPAAWTEIGPDPADLRSWIDRHRPAAVVVTGSAPHALAVSESPAKLVLFAAPGGGADGLLGAVYSDADLILAPWPATSLRPWPAAWRARTIHVGALGWRAANEAGAAAPTAGGPRHRGRAHRCVVLGATAGDPGPRERRDLMTQTHGWQWTYAAEHDLVEPGPVWDRLRAADVVVCAPSEPAFAALAALRRPAVLVLPERATSCQRVLAELAESSAPVVVTRGWPEPARWPALLDVAQVLDGNAWHAWDSEAGLAELATRLGVSADPVATTARRTPRRQLAGGSAAALVQDHA